LDFLIFLTKLLYSDIPPMAPRFHSAALLLAVEFNPGSIPACENLGDDTREKDPHGSKSGNPCHALDLASTAALQGPVWKVNHLPIPADRGDPPHI
jgi:hypothetical protein